MQNYMQVYIIKVKEKTSPRIYEGEFLFPTPGAAQRCAKDWYAQELGTNKNEIIIKSCFLKK